MVEPITTCRALEDHLARYVDGEETPAARRFVEAHLAACPPCLARADAERAARDVVHEHRDVLRAAAPADLRARCAALQSSAASRQSSMSSVRRWVPLSLAASLVLAIAGVFAFGLNDRVEALAASLTIDHVKCFKVSGKPAHAEPAVAARAWKAEQGWPIVVPPSAPGQQLALVDVRRCFSTDGRAAHMMYTWRGAPLSLYVLQESPAHDRVVKKMGHGAVIWGAHQRTYAVVTEGQPQELTQVVEYMKAHAR